jgi:YbbR domain-containing protein
VAVLWKGWRENLALKAIALSTAVAIWAYVGFTEKPPVTSRDFDAEVVPSGTPPDDVVVRLRQDTVRVTVRGPKDEVDKLGPDAIKAIADLRSAQVNLQRVAIARYKGPVGATHLEFDGARPYVNAEVVAKERRRMPVGASYSNEPPPGRLYSVRLDPSMADVVGARDALDRVSQLLVYVGSQGGNVRAQVPIKALDANGVLVPEVQIDPPTARVELDLVEAPTSRTLVVSPIVRGRPSPPYIVSDIIVEPLQVTVVGKAGALAALTHLTTVEIPIDGIKADTLRDVPLQLPPAVAVKDGHSTVRVIIRVTEVGRAAGPSASP